MKRALSSAAAEPLQDERSRPRRVGRLLDDLPAVEAARVQDESFVPRPRPAEKRARVGDGHVPILPAAEDEERNAQPPNRRERVHREELRLPRHADHPSNREVWAEGERGDPAERRTCEEHALRTTSPTPP